MNRLNQILVGVLVLQLIVGFIVLWPRDTASGGEAESLLLDVGAEEIARLTITDGEGQVIILAKQAGEWSLPEADDYPVMADSVASFLDKIVALKADRLITQTSDSHKRLKVADGDYESLVEVELDDGTVHRFYLGTSPSFGATHIRVDDEDEVYLTGELSAQDTATGATNWVDRTYFSVPQEQVVGLTLENANGRFEFEKDATQGWMMLDLAADEVLNESSVQTLVNRATSVAMLRPLGTEELDAYGLQEPSATLALVTHSDEAGTKTYTLIVGAQDPKDKSFVIISSESRYYVRVSEWTVNEFAEKARDGFLVVPTSMPEATPES